MTPPSEAISPIRPIGPIPRASASASEPAPFPVTRYVVAYRLGDALYPLHLHPYSTLYSISTEELPVTTFGTMTEATLAALEYHIPADRHVIHPTR